MPHTTAWLVKNRVGLITFVGAITIDDLRQVNQDATLLLRLNASHPVHVIADFTAATAIPQDIAQLTGIMRVLYERNMGWMLMAGIAFPSLRYNLTLLLRQASVRHLSVKTVQDALTTISLLDIALDPDATQGYKTDEMAQN